MKLIRIRDNKADPVILEYADGTRLFFSYESPIGAFVPGRGYLATDADLTPTSERRLADWLKDKEFSAVPQDEIFNVFTSRPFTTRSELTRPQ